MKNIIITALVAMALLAGCSSVRKGYVKRSEEPRGKSITGANEVKNIDTKDNIIQEHEKPKRRFSDTTYIYLSKMGDSPPPSSNEYTKAVQIYEAGDYEESCMMFNLLKEQLSESDPNYYDVMFYCSECLIIDDDMYGAESILKDLLVNTHVSNKIRQKVLVRLGQVYCVLDNKDMANTLFKKLKQEFPNSVYIPLANCESVSE